MDDPHPDQAYRDGWDNIFGPRKPTDEEIRAARYALDMAEHNDSPGMTPTIAMRRKEYYALLKSRDGK